MSNVYVTDEVSKNVKTYSCLLEKQYVKINNDYFYLRDKQRPKALSCIRIPCPEDEVLNYKLEDQSNSAQWKKP